MNPRAAAIVAVLAALLAVTLWFVFQEDDSHVDAGDRGEKAATEEPGKLAGEPDAGGKRGDLDEERRSTPGGKGKGHAGEVQKVTLRGRVVARESKQPLAGCRVLLKVPDNTYYRMLMFHAGLDFATLQEQERTTGEDGRFEFVFETTMYLTFSAVITAQGRVRSTGWLEGFRETKRDLGDISLVKGVPVRGIVRNRKGAPVPGVKVYAEGPSSEGSGAFTEESMADAVTGAAGQFEFTTPLYPGTWIPLLRGRFLEKPDEFVVKDQALRIELTCYGADELPKLRGKIVDQHGVAVGGVKVDFSPSGNYPISWGHYADENGQFVIEKRPDDPEKVTLSFEADGCGPKKVPDVKWGGKPLTVELVRAPSLELTVREVGTAKPVEWFGVLLSHTDRDMRYMTGTSPLLNGRHPGGRVTVDKLRPGKNLLMVTPRDKRFAYPDFVAIDVVDANTTVSPVVVELHEKVSRRARVVLQDGTPVPGTQVELVLSSCGMPVTLKTRCTAPVPLEGFTLANDQGVWLHRATTDGDGYTTLSGDPRIDYTARVVGEGHLPKVQAGVRVDPKLGDLEIRVEAGATIEGRILPANFTTLLMPSPEQMRAWKAKDPEMFTTTPVGIIAMSSARQRRPKKGGMQVARDGSFRLTGLQPGDWRLNLFWSDVLEDGESWGHGMSLANVQNLTARETRRIKIDLRRKIPTTVTGTLLLNGAPVKNREALAISFDGTERLAARTVKTDDQGRFTYRTLAGRWRVALWQDSPEDDEYSFQLMSGFQDVAPGPKTTRTFHFESVRAAFVAVKADGTPVPRCRIFAQLAGGRETGFPPTNAKGETYMPHVMPGEYRITVYAKDGKKTFDVGTFTAAKGAAPMKVTVPADAGF